MAAKSAEKFYAHECDICRAMRSYPFSCAGYLDGGPGHKSVESRRVELVPKRDVADFVGPVDLERRIRAARDSGRKKVLAQITGKAGCAAIREFLSRETNIMFADDVIRDIIRLALNAPKTLRSSEPTSSGKDNLKIAA